MPESVRPDHFEASPFPRVHWNEYSWEGTVTLPAFAGFQCRRGPYGTMSAAEPSDGSAQITAESPDASGHAPPSAAQAAAVELIRSRQVELRDALLDALLTEYEKVRDDLSGEFDADEAERVIPKVTSPDGFRNLIGLNAVHVQTVERDGLAYVGLEFGCTWDEEHALGFMTHGTRVVKVGGADTSFLAWIAERDAAKGNAG